MVRHSGAIEAPNTVSQDEPQVLHVRASPMADYPGQKRWPFTPAKGSLHGVLVRRDADDGAGKIRLSREVVVANPDLPYVPQHRHILALAVLIGGGTVAFSFLPESPATLTKETVAALSITFAALVLLGPIYYVAAASWGNWPSWPA